MARALSGRLPYPPTQEELGALIEALVFHEVRAFLDYRELRYPLHFWRNYDGAEVEFEAANNWITGVSTAPTTIKPGQVGVSFRIIL